MNNLKPSVLAFLLLISAGASAQQALSLQQAVETALKQSKTLKQEQTAILIAESKSKSVEEARLPDLSVSGQMMYLPYAPHVDLKIQQQSQASTEGQTQDQAGFPVPKTVAFGGLNASLPIFTGFKLKNNLTLAEKNVDLAHLSADAKAEYIAYQVTSLYLNLYKADQAIEVLDKNILRSEQRVKDFSNFVEQGLMPENDLLKAKLQQANLEVARQEAQKTREVLEYRINVLLNRDPQTGIQPQFQFLLPEAESNFIGISNRKDIEILRKRREVTGLGIELARGSFYPNLALTAGYLNLYVPNTITVTNALNLGLGLKYNISSLYKNKSEVKTAQLQALQVEQAISEAEDQAQLEVMEARKEYELSAKKQRVYEEAEKQAKENLRIVTNKNNNGLADTDQLLEAEVQNLQAGINVATGKADLQLAWYKMLQVSGSLLDYLQISK